jgi:hypothetical protein
MYHRSAAATTWLEKKKAQHTSQRRHLTRNASSATVTCTSYAMASREASNECSNFTKAFAISTRLNTSTAMPWPSAPDGLQLLQASIESETKATSKLLRHSKEPDHIYHDAQAHPQRELEKKEAETKANSGSLQHKKEPDLFHRNAQVHLPKEPEKQAVEASARK